MKRFALLNLPEHKDHIHEAHTFMSIIPYSFLLLWSYAAVMQLGQIDQTKLAMAMQLFPEWAVDILWWLLPTIHIILLVILLYRPWVRLGMVLSTLLLSAYTVYLISGVTKVFGSTPCACAGIWPTNSHWLHIALNSIFIILGIVYGVLARRSRPVGDVPPDVRRREGTAAS